jgi:hypothetical protein
MLPLAAMALAGSAKDAAGIPPVSAGTVLAEESSLEFLTRRIPWSYGQSASHDPSAANDDRNMFPVPPPDDAALSDVDRQMFKQVNTFNDGVGLSAVTGSLGTMWRDGRHGSDVILAELDGPGVVTQFWGTVSPQSWCYLSPGERREFTTKALSKPIWGEHGKALLAWSQDRVQQEPMIEFYFDGESEPRLAMTLKDYFGDFPAFAGLAGGDPRDESRPGYYNFVPMPFAQSLKVMVKHKPPVLYYNLKYRAYPAGTEVKTFELKDLDADAVAGFAAMLKDAQVVDRFPGAAKVTELPLAGGVKWASADEGVLTRLSLRLKDPTILAGVDAARIKIWWDGAGTPAVDAPVGMFFGVLGKGEGWYGD